MQGENVTAVILNYNSSSDCGTCIQFLKKQDYDRLSIIVVDNASTVQGEKRRLQELCDENHIQLILSSENRGFSAGNNIGLRAAARSGSTWMLVINPDVELRDPHYVSYVMSQLGNWPETAVIGTKIFLPDGEPQNPMRELTVLEEFFWPFEIVKQRLGVWNGYRTKDETGYCEKVSGCCFFISREFLEKIGYLDENVFMYCEEPILSKCVKRAGYQELYIKEVTANHEHYEHKKRDNSKTKMACFLKSRKYYIERYSGYGELGKRMTLFSRELQRKLWERRG